MSENQWYDGKKVCKQSDTPPLWKMDSTKSKELEYFDNNGSLYYIYVDQRTLISETEDKYLKFIQNAALYFLAFNCGVIAYWYRKYKPILDDFRTNHGAENENGERNGQPRIQSILLCPIPGCCIKLNRFIILVNFGSKILVPFFDSITGKLN